MSDLQLALLGAGGALVGGVWLFNFLQERKHKKLAEEIFHGGQQDVLLQGQGDADARSEPSIAPVHEQRIEPAVSLPPGEEQAALPAPPPLWADDIADCMLRIDLVEAVSAPTLWAVQSAWAGQLTKAHAWLGYDEAAGDWCRLDAHDAGRYSHLAVALQLADRQGAVTDEELGVFLDGVHRVAQQFSGLVELPQRQDVLVRAQSLDAFCAGVDVQLGVNVVAAEGMFPGTKLRGLAESAGLALQDDGRFHAGDDAGLDLFVVGNLGPELFEADSLKTLATQGVTFVLDVPRVADGPAAFDRMVAVARHMAQVLNGAVVDGQRHPLSDATIAGIRSKIGEIQQQMAANQIPPGSPRALRLFS